MQEIIAWLREVEDPAPPADINRDPTERGSSPGSVMRGEH